jgi:DNA-binding transcriptional LysR family regulator
MPANRAHLCAWLSVSLGRDKQERRLSEEYPGITVHVAQMSRPITFEIEHLRERKVDLIIGRGIFRIPEDDLNAEILFEEPSSS